MAKRNKKPCRYWLGYRQVSYFKYRLANIFTSEYLEKYYARFFFYSKWKEKRIYDDPILKVEIEKYRSNPDFSDFTIKIKRKPTHFSRGMNFYLF